MKRKVLFLLGFPDPEKATGSDDEVMAVFGRVRDDIAQQVPALLKTLAAA